MALVTRDVKGLTDALNKASALGYKPENAEAASEMVAGINGLQALSDGAISFVSLLTLFSEVLFSK